MFVEGLFKHGDQGTVVAFRAFDRDSKPFGMKYALRLNGAGFGALVDLAFDVAESCANGDGVVFCPPIATFKKKGNTKTTNLANGLALSVECDKAPNAARERLEKILGPPTFVVESGGIWANPEGGEENKLHLHWRLSCPTRTEQEHRLLYEARKIAQRLVGADATNNSLVHPIRWPGSWHTKGHPRPCHIVEENDVEIDLDGSFELLRIAAERKGIETGLVSRTASPAKLIAPSIEDVRSALEQIPNDGPDWDYWSYICGSVLNAADGDAEGDEAAHEWSAKCVMYDAGYTEQRLEEIKRSPYTHVGWPTLAWLARQANPDWVAPNELELEASIDEEFSKYCQEEKPKRPTIKILPGKLHRMVQQSEDALIAGGEPLYARGVKIVRPVVGVVPAAGGRTTKTPQLHAVSVDDLWGRLSKVARYVKYNVRKDEFVTADPPRAIASVYLAQVGDWILPPLVGIISTPTLRADGSILAEPGYDAATGVLLINPPHVAIPDRPTRKDARKALKLLSKLLCEFPFADEASRSVVLSGMITPLVRGAVPVAPLHAITAPVAGTGKSYAWDIAAAIAIGDHCPVISKAAHGEELEKRLSAELMTGPPIISIDNVNGELGGDFLCQAIERPRPKVRILGKSEMVEIDSRTTIYTTGNNLQIYSDLVRRTIRATLDARVERPELREFKNNPVSMVLANRERYVTAALTIVRAYIIADYPDILPPLASFEAWSNIVRSALVWLGCTDPVKTMEQTRADDPELSDLRAFIGKWQEAVGEGRRLTAKELIDAFDDDELLQDLLQDGVSPRSLGKWLKAYQGRIIDGATICAKEDKKKKVNRWFWIKDGV